MNFKIAFEIAKKDFFDMKKNGAFIGAFVVPLLFSIVLWFVIPSTPQAPGLVIVKPPAKLLELFSLNTPFTVRSANSLEDVQLAVNDQRLTLGLVLDKDFIAEKNLNATVFYKPEDAEWIPFVEVALLRYNLEIHEQTENVKLNLQSTQKVDENAVNSRQTSLAYLIFATLISVGCLIIPNMVMEEKDSGTLRLILMSQASSSEFIASKLIIGTGSMLVLALILLAINSIGAEISSWHTLLLLTVLGSIIMVEIGIFMGMYFDNSAQMNNILPFVIFPLLSPAILYDLGKPWDSILFLIPSHPLFLGLNTASATQSLLYLTILLAWAISLFLGLFFLLSKRELVR